MTNEDMDFIANLFKSLESELKKDIGEVRDEVRAVNTRLDQTNSRLDRIGGLVNGGSRAIAKMIEWTERTDVSLADVLRRQTDFEQRLRKLEGDK